MARAEAVGRRRPIPRSAIPPSLTLLEASLAPLPAGPCRPDSQPMALLLRAWTHLHGGCAGEMTRDQLVGRIASADWSPPVLSFTVERAPRGAGASVAQVWQVDVQDGTAWIAGAGRVALPPKVAAAELAVKLARGIVAGEDAPSVIRKTAGSIAIRPGDVPGLDIGSAETLPGRHHRFRGVLEHALESAGFTCVGRYRFLRGA